MNKEECRKQKEDWMIKQIQNKGYAEGDCGLECEKCTRWKEEESNVSK